MSVPVSPSPQSGKRSTKKNDAVVPGWVVGLVVASACLGVFLFFVTGRASPAPPGRPAGGGPPHRPLG